MRKPSPTIYLYFLAEREPTSIGGGEIHLQPFTNISWGKRNSTAVGGGDNHLQPITRISPRVKKFNLSCRMRKPSPTIYLYF
jgi:hypothetical protein